MASPAVWIRVVKVTAVPKSFSSYEGFFDLGIGIEDAQASKQLNVGGEFPIRSNWSVDLEPITRSCVEVVGAVAWRGMYRPGTLLNRYVVSQNSL